MADAVDLAEAVAVEMSVYPWAAPTTVARGYLSPERALKDMKSMVVDVFFSAVEAEMETRTDDQYDTRIDLIFQQAVADIGAATLDPLVKLVQAVRDHWRRKRLAAYPAAACWRTELAVPALPEALKDESLFLAVLTLTFREVN